MVISCVAPLAVGDGQPLGVGEDRGRALVERGRAATGSPASSGLNVLRGTKNRRVTTHSLAGRRVEEDGRAAAPSPLIRTLVRCDQSVGANVAQLVDPVDDALEDPAVPARRLAVAADAVAGVPAPAVDLPGGLDRGRRARRARRALTSARALRRGGLGVEPGPLGAAGRRRAPP